MLNETSINKLKALIDQQPEPTRGELTAAMEDITRAIGTLSLLSRNLRMELDNAMVDMQAVNRLVTQGSLQQMLGMLNPPKRNSFTMDEARTACNAVVQQIAAANDFSNILKAVVQVAKVFI